MALYKLFIIIVIAYSVSGCNDKTRSDKHTKSSESITQQNKQEQEYIVNKRILDSLNAYMNKQEALWDSHPSLLIYYIAFDKAQSKTSIIVELGVSNIAPWVTDTAQGQIFGYFKNRQSKVLVLDREVPIADTLYNRTKLIQYVEQTGGEPPGSGYTGEPMEFEW